MPKLVHDHHEPQGDDMLGAVKRAVEAAGEQWTPMREGVFEALSSFTKPASAYDVTEALSRMQQRRVAANSVYRILDLFVQANVAQRVESENAYLLNAHPGCRHDCIFLVCDRCGRTDHIDDDRIGGTVRRTAEGAGFSPTRPVIEVRGTCGLCAADRTVDSRSVLQAQ